MSQLQSPAPLLQSWAWGEVQSRAGWRLERVRLGESGLASVQLRGRPLLERGYVPRGPVAAGGAALKALVSWARERRLARLRVEPEAGVERGPELRALGFQPAPFVQPQHTLIVPLAEPDQMLGTFKRGTRYNIRLAERGGITVVEGRDAAEMERQAAASASRQRINLPGRAYFELLLDRLPDARTYVAQFEGEAVSALLVAHHDGRAYDLYSGSNGRHARLKPAYATKWAALTGAFRAGCRDYDLWGVSPGPDRSHPWYGLWEFKSGFGGELVEYVGCWDLVLGEVRQAVAEVGERARRRVGKLLRKGD